MFRRAVVAALVLAVVGCGHDPGPPKQRPLPHKSKNEALRGGGPPRSARIANYKIDARLDVDKHVITATQTLSWTNSGTTSVHSLPFHLYLNAFKNEDSLFMRGSHGQMRGAEAGRDSWGWIRIESIKIAGEEQIEKLQRRLDKDDPDETVAILPLATPVEPAGTIELDFKFTAKLPEVFARTGYKGEFHMVAQWFPKIGVFVGDRWECRPFHAFQEFFADFGTYDVTLTVPNTYLVAATGILASASEAPNEQRTYTYRAEDVHDFAWMADPYMDVMSGQAKVEDGTVEVLVVHRPEQREFARRHLDAAIGAIERFSAWFLPYPWPVMTVVDPPVDAMRGAGGMEYPTLVTTAGDSVFARPGIRIPEYVTVHEVGHNWFQGILASNEPLEAWLDEGVNTWADDKVMADLYGPAGNGIDWGGWQADIAALTRAVSDDPASLPSPIATAAFAFADQAAYANASYQATARALTVLEHTVEPGRFAAAMKKYARDFAFKHPTGRDLFATLAAELGDLSWFYQPAFQELGGMKLRVRSAECWNAHGTRGVRDVGKDHKVITEVDAPDTGTFACEVVVTNTGPLRVPVDIDLIFADGSKHTEHWTERGSWKRFTVERSVPLVEVRIDPENRVTTDHPTRHAYRLVGDGDASLRAAAWFGATAQTLMQVVGP